MRFFRKYAAFLVCLICRSGVLATNAPQTQELSVHTQLKIVKEFQKLIEEKYVLEDKATLLADGLSNAIKSGLYSEPESPAVFVKRTNLILQQSFADRHLGILTPEKFQQMMQMFGSSPTDQTDAETGHVAPAGGHARTLEDHGSARNREQKGLDALRQIAGITRVAEISRDGLNQVGYMAFERFIHSEKAKAIVRNIFQTFTESERLIIDLRECKGGDAEMVKFISDYFFKQPTHLTSSTVLGGAPVERWTQPNSLSPIFARKKLDILVSKQTFSAAESFAFGLKQTGRARILGQSTGGGGHMNDFFQLPAGFGASISIGRTYDPRSGEGWQNKGVIPDVVFPKDHTLSETMKLITVESGKLESFSDEQLKAYRILQAYTNAWYSAKADEMKDLISIEFKAIYSSKGKLEKRDYHQQLAATEQGSGVLPKLFHNRIIRNIEVSGSKATAELVLRETTHEIQLLKSGRGWKIVRDDYHDKSFHD